jgi:hypothetical protein
MRAFYERVPCGPMRALSPRALSVEVTPSDSRPPSLAPPPPAALRQKCPSSPPLPSSLTAPLLSLCDPRPRSLAPLPPPSAALRQHRGQRGQPDHVHHLQRQPAVPRVPHHLQEVRAAARSLAPAEASPATIATPNLPPGQGASSRRSSSAPPCLPSKMPAWWPGGLGRIKSTADVDGDLEDAAWPSGPGEAWLACTTTPGPLLGQGAS